MAEHFRDSQLFSLGYFIKNVIDDLKNRFDHVIEIVLKLC